MEGIVRVDSSWFRDEHGRRLILRGANLGGSSKVPTHPDGATYRRDSLDAPRDASFIGRPFPLDEADEHFSRLKRWGLTFHRLLTTWEAIEHAGPGQYDRDYLDYLEAIVRKAGEHGLSLFIDPHEDVWSRFTGGDGAPAWTLEAAGFDLRNLHATGAAFLHQEHGDPLPRMIWPTNNGKLAAATMFTLFFGGNDFAPQLKVNGEPIQEFLQHHYLEAIAQVAQRLRGLDHVIGYDTFNEPSAGYIGVRDLTALPPLPRLGAAPTPYESMQLGEGAALDLPTWGIRMLGMRRIGHQLVNAGGLRAWSEGAGCIWLAHGVWDQQGGVPHLLKPDYFHHVQGREVSFTQDYYKPFAVRFAERIRCAHPGAAIFLESEPGVPPPRWDKGDPSGIVWAPHWYDGLTLVLKQLVPFLGLEFEGSKIVLGARRVRRSFASQLATQRHAAAERLGGVPTLMGEIGIPFDLDDKRAYRTGDFRSQSKALDRSMQALEANLLSATLWDYTSDNTNAHGDLWNDEDFSIFSRDQQADPADPDSGGRALDALLRPYPQAVAGEPLAMTFDFQTGVFMFSFAHDSEVAEPTILYVPRVQYPGGCRIAVSDGEAEYQSEEQRVVYRHSGDRRTHTIRLARGG
jgi:hypothetical protein